MIDKDDDYFSLNHNFSKFDESIDHMKIVEYLELDENKNHLTKSTRITLKRAKDSIKKRGYIDDILKKPLERCKDEVESIKWCNEHLIRCKK
jgi:hypothetical protein